MISPCKRIDACQRRGRSSAASSTSSFSVKGNSRFASVHIDAFTHSYLSFRTCIQSISPEFIGIGQIHQVGSYYRPRLTRLGRR
jgi:hypothetical protein